MLTLKKMNEKEYNMFLKRSISSYAIDNIKSGNWTAEEANEKSLQDHLKLLPHGLVTPNHYLYMIEQDGETVGSIWYEFKVQSPLGIAFLFDLYVKEPFRNRGIGFEVMKLFEKEALNLGAKCISLHVFGSNLVAKKLYEKLGFKITNINMSKPLI